MILKRMIVPMLCALCATAWAGDGTSQAMLQTARQAMRAQRPIERVMANDQLAVYSQRGGGFAVLTAAEQSPRVLAYSPTATLRVGSDNPGFGWWLRSVQRVLQASALHHAPTTKPDTTRFAPRVDSLITTLWGQREPFKFMCPFDTYFPDRSLDGTYQPDSGHFVVGCVATAMAQYMNYYHYPRHGVGQDSVVVKYSNPAVSVTYRVDFEHTNYDWANMIDDYQGEYTPQQAEAVAQLCYHCGVAAHTTYNQYGGGSTDVDCLRAMREIFAYNDTAHYIVRSKYSEPDWMEMVYRELSDGHPILYSGRDINLEEGIIGAHNFIIDGYDEEGMVHVNWGWYGLENGFFDIALLDPRQYSYDDWQAMYVGLYPAEQSIMGDVTGDGVVDIADVNAVINAMLGKDTSDELQTASDVTGDGQVDIADVNAVINLMLGK
ncbi:MAG: C10 family peptidase [Muribaculaceae bacterium]|nr:C10 family peptidase [Muribaculaceae bacterium]